MRILITGGAGYIGSHACKVLAQAGIEPVVLDNMSRGHRKAVQWGPLVEADVADREALDRAFQRYRIEGVMHFAAFAYVGESMEKPGLYFQNNAVNSLGLLEAMRANGVRHIVFSSTCATYGIPHHVPIAETHEQRPVNPYGESKLFVERLLDWYGRIHGFSWVALRYFNAAGADPEGSLGEDHDPETHLIPRAIDAALGVIPQLDIFGTDYDTPDGTAIRDYLHVTDLGHAHVAALRYLQSGGASCALNLGTGKGHSVREVATMVEKITGHKVPTREAPRRAGDPAALVAQATKAGAVLGWQPRLSSLDEIVTTGWNWKLRSRSGHKFPALV